ncbi:MAG: DAK2 domain-containing protein [Intrasporangium sp.]|uniref:DAK2 domain-containing protein n=1 Tax=Intrasporangium sp. TaxID=1925024 RepID=UPI003F7DC1CB
MELQELVVVLDKSLASLSGHREALRDLDAAVGDGDLGITVDKGAEAVRQALAESPPETVGTLLRTAGAAFAKANPSTMAALVGAGLLAASKEAGDAAQWDVELAERVGRAAMARIAERGKAELGDKTVLDALAPSLDALHDSPSNPLPAMVSAAERGVEETRDRPGRRGRAAWVGERGSGHPDPGATAYVLFLESLQDSVD